MVGFCVVTDLVFTFDTTDSFCYVASVLQQVVTEF